MIIGTEKGRFARLRDERIQRSVNGASFFTTDQRITEAQKAYVETKYAKKERNSRKGETKLPETRNLSGEQIRERLTNLFGGDGRYPLSKNILPGVNVTEEQIDSQRPKITKKSLNGPDIPPDKIRPKDMRQPYDTTKGDYRDDKKRPVLQDTVSKAKNTADTSTLRNAWKGLDAKTRNFLKEKTK